MTIAYKSQGAGAASATSAAALNVAHPAVVDANDILILHKTIRNTTTAFTTPGGWTLLAGPTSISTVMRHAVYGKLAVGTEDGTNLNIGAEATTALRMGRIYSFSGRESGTITDLVRGFLHGSGTTIGVADTGITTTLGGSVAVNLVGVADDNTIGSFTGETGGDWTERVAEFVSALGLQGMIQIQVADMASTGTVDGGSVNMSAADPWGVHGFEIRTNPTTTLPTPEVVLDDFNDGVIGSYWSNWGGGQVVETSGQLQITTVTGGGYFGIDQIAVRDYTGAFAGSEVVNAGNQSLGSYQPVPILLNFGTNNHVYWIIEGGNAKCYTNVATVVTQRGASITYDSAIHRHFAIGILSGNLVWVWSTDGVNWVTHTTLANPFSGDTTAFATIQAGAWNTEASATTFIVDNFTTYGLNYTVDLAPAELVFTAVPLDPVPQPGLVTLTPATLTLTPVSVTPVPGVVTVNLTPAVLTFTAVPLPIQGRATLTPAVVTFTAVPLTPVSQPVQIALQPAMMAFAGVAVNPIPQAVTVALTPAAMVFTAVPLTPVPGVVTVSLVPAIMTFTAVAITPIPQPVTVVLAPTIITFTAVPMTVGGVGAVTLTPAVLTFTAVPLTSVPGVVTVDLMPAVVTFTSVPLSPVAGGFVSLVPTTLAFTAVPVTPIPQAVVLELTPSQLIFTAVPLILPVIDTEPKPPDVVAPLLRNTVVGVIGEAMFGLPASNVVIGLDGRTAVFGGYAVQEVEGKISP